jgi:hypothetical protein
MYTPGIFLGIFRYLKKKIERSEIFFWAMGVSTRMSQNGFPISLFGL